MRKFSLLSRAALKSMAAAAIGAATPGAEVPNEDEDDDPEAGPQPSDAPADPERQAPADTPPAGEAPADDAEAAAEAGVQVVTLADANAHGAEQFAAGRKAERDRTAAVMGSDAGKANPAMAGWMLSSSPDASADAIVSQLAGMPGAPAPAAQTIPDTNVNLGKPGAAAAVAEGADGTGDDIWGEVQGTKGGSAAPVVASDAGRATLAAIQAGGRTVNTGAAAPSNPSTPAVVPTGN